MLLALDSAVPAMFVRIARGGFRRFIFVSMHILRRISYVLPLAFLAVSCGILSKTEKASLPKSPYSALPAALSDEYFHSPAGDIAGRYPADWLRVDISSIPMEHVLFVYTDRDRRRALILSEIPATAEFRRNVERDGITAVADQSFATKTARRAGLSIVHPTDIYTISNRLFASYEYAEPGDSTRRRINRVAVFTTGARFYELALAELSDPNSSTEHTTNFQLLESVIGSLEGVAQVGGLPEDRPSGDATGAF
jgi:hypothetical protein